MTFSSLIQKGGLEKLATATYATNATHWGNSQLIVAYVATVAVAHSINSNVEPEKRTALARLLTHWLRNPKLDDERWYRDFFHLKDDYESTGQSDKHPFSMALDSAIEAIDNDTYLHSRFPKATWEVKEQSVMVVAAFLTADDRIQIELLEKCKAQ